MTSQPDAIIADDTHVDHKFGIGHNNPPPTLMDADTLAMLFGSADQDGKYTPLAKDVAALLADIGATVPKVIETDHDNGIIAAHMESLRTTLKTVGNYHEAEKAPYLTAGRFCDQFFFSFRDRLTKARDILQARGNDYTQRKIAQERAERMRIAREAEQAAQKERERLAQIERDRIAAEQAAERARKPENIAAHEDRAQDLRSTEAIAQVDAMIAADKVEDTTRAAAAPSADLARTRHVTGQLSTAKQVPFVKIEDDSKLDKAILWSLIDDDAKLKALKVYAKITKYKKPMDGAIIEMRDAADYR